MATDDTSTQQATDASAHQSDNSSDNASVPTVDELMQKNAALHKGMDQANIAKKDLESQITKLQADLALAKGETQTQTNTKTDNFLTKDDLWEFENRDKISLASDEYKKYKDLGISRDLALRLALDDKGIKTDTALHEHLRQAQTSSAASSIDRFSGAPDQRSPIELEMDARMGITADDRKKFGPKVAEMLKGLNI